MEMLYRTDGSFLKARDREQVVENCGENLVNILGKTILITIADERRNLMEPHVYICNNNGSENLLEQVVENCGENLVNILGKTILITIADERRNLMEPHVYICNNNGSENLFKLVKEREIIKECFRTGKTKGVGVKVERRNLMEPHVYICNNNGSENLFKLVKEREIIKECFRTGKTKGVGVKVNPSTYQKTGIKEEGSNAYYVPIKGNYLTLGVIGVACYKREILSDEEKKIIKIVAEQTAIALRKYLCEKTSCYYRRRRRKTCSED